MADDIYLTIKDTSIGMYSEKRSKFIAIAIPVSTINDIQEQLKIYQNKYHDARHICYAYMLGYDKNQFRVNDNGEPSGTAGKPILGQINSNNLTNILIIVVRYFGGIKLGTSGLIVAYRTAASEALTKAQIIQKTIDCIITIQFEYVYQNSVMKIIKEMQVNIEEQHFDLDCIMQLRIRKSLIEELKNKLMKIQNLIIKDEVDNDE
jgi:uncharacterized YigZ family protein